MRVIKLLLRFPRFGAYLLCPCLLVAYGLAGAAGSDSNDAECLRFELGETLISEIELEDIDTNLKSIVAARLLYVNRDGHCLPTNDTYLVGLTWEDYPIMLSVLTFGHTPKARIERFGREDMLLVFYTTGASTYVLQPYRFSENWVDAEIGIERLATSFYSTLKSIEVADGMVVARYSRKVRYGEWALTTESHRYEGGEFVPVAKETEFHRYDEESEEFVTIEGKTESYRYEDGEFVLVENN